MAIIVLRCSNCDKKRELPYEIIETTYGKACRKCGHSEPKVIQHNLCSLKCMAEFAQKWKNHKCGDYWIVNGYEVNTKNGKKTKAYVSCRICGKSDIIKVKE